MCSCECTVFLFVEVNTNICIAFKENDHISIHLCITWVCFIVAKILIELLIISCVYSRSGVIEKMEALELENQEKMEVEESGRSGARQGRSEHRRFHREVCVFGFYFSFF